MYGALTTLAAEETYRHGQARRLDLHRAWAIRLFSLVIGSWLYRMEYGFWIAAMGGFGSTQVFTGPFDHVMAFFFNLPNLAIAELYVRSTGPGNFAVRAGSVAASTLAAALILVGSAFFVVEYWGLGILAAL